MRYNKQFIRKKRLKHRAFISRKGSIQGPYLYGHLGTVLGFDIAITLYIQASNFSTRVYIPGYPGLPHCPDGPNEVNPARYHSQDEHRWQTRGPPLSP